ncbi:MAG: hypothetical protein GY714_18325 [Desulfobacterales bacterium]|nr:hypothetical protein [Desulfobacterales bacterium]
MSKNKPGQGRKPIAAEKRRVPFSTIIDPFFLKKFREYCKKNKMSHGKIIELAVRHFTDNFSKSFKK